MASWPSGELDRIGRLKEIEISSERSNGELRRWTPIWVVRAGDELYVRSGGGAEGGWYRYAVRSPVHIRTAGVEQRVRLELQTDPSVQSEVDRVYRKKYRFSPFRRFLLNAAAQSTTSRLVPEWPE
ncbi:DUF2255 family protein [Streptomyces sp. NPDC059629]|uniref:DUF2255 family protein n=1 Tax=Streptomyces sp. NPDC059629 TaxID=3346889 RepID=UPI0036B1BD84